MRRIRPTSDGPIIFPTGAEEDAVAGYGLGADDYVRKPFGARGAARASRPIYAVSGRRARTPSPSREVRIDLGARGLAVGGEAVPLTPTEPPSASTSPATPGRS